MRFLNWLGFHDLDLKLNTSRLGVALFWALFMLGASFLPAINLPVFFKLENFSTDFSSERFMILLVEVVGILLNLINLKTWAVGVLVFSVYEIGLSIYNHVFMLGVINDHIDETARILSDERATLGWGWFFILLGPVAVAFQISREKWRGQGKKA